MKKYIIAAVTIAAFAGMSFAQEPAAPAQKPAEAPKMAAPKAVRKEVVKMDTVNGAITAIDAVGNTLTVKDEKGMDKTLTIDARKLAALKVGDNVKIKAKDNKVVIIKSIKEHKGKKAGSKKA